MKSSGETSFRLGASAGENLGNLAARFSMTANQFAPLSLSNAPIVILYATQGITLQFLADYMLFFDHEQMQNESESDSSSVSFLRL